MDIGIIGLPQSGKTTVFNALTGGKADTVSHAEGLNPHIGVAKVPEPRLTVLDDILHPRKIVPAEARYLDIGASVRVLSQDKGIGGELLNQLSNVDLLVSIVRAFADDRIPHPAGSLDIKRDITNLNLELVLSDLAIMERRLERIEISLKGAKAPERQGLIREQELLLKLKTDLEKDVPIREMALDSGESRILTNYQFLTAKPLLIVVNIGEEQLAQAASLEAALNTQYSGGRCGIVTLCAKLEMELGQLENDAAREFRAEFGIKESGLERITKAAYRLAGLISFFSIASNEVRAWPINKGTTASKAAGKIHTDMEKGFIRAEGIGYDDLVKCGSIAEARKQGLLRLEGKDYIIQDGDIITFLFNV
ncbi:MAG: redox-regulated ATPase YchF [Chloroflexi bacterium RBG_16_50_9]|nr:MAG: redox-regulated ATPase YchF [Chloroflexi bacterium RBG_16_50_9]